MVTGIILAMVTPNNTNIERTYNTYHAACIFKVAILIAEHGGSLLEMVFSCREI